MFPPSINTKRKEFSEFHFHHRNDNRESLFKFPDNIIIDKDNQTIKFDKVLFHNASRIVIEKNYLKIYIGDNEYLATLEKYNVVFNNCVFDTTIAFFHIEQFSSCIFSGNDNHVNFELTNNLNIKNCTFDGITTVNVDSKSMLTNVNIEQCRIKNLAVHKSENITIYDTTITNDILSTLKARKEISIKKSTLNKVNLSNLDVNTKLLSVSITENSTINKLDFSSTVKDIEIQNSHFDKISFTSLTNNESDINIISSTVNTIKFLNLYNKYTISDCTITDLSFLDIKNEMDKKNSFFYLYRGTVENVTIKNAQIGCKFYLNKQYDENKDKTKITTLEITQTVFKENFKLHSAEVTTVNIHDVDFMKNADFYDTEFMNGNSKEDTKNNILKNDIDFKAINFHELALFGNTIFYKKLILRYVTFKGHSHFRQAEFKDGLDLDYCNIQQEMNFFGVQGLNTKASKKRTSQETYRIIKHNFEKLNNKIEANDFHSLELYKKGKELDKQIKQHFTDWLIFKFHHNVSNHSTDPALTLHWIISVALLSTLLSFLSHKYYNIDAISLAVFLPVLVLSIIYYNEKRKLFYFGWGIIVLFAWLVNSEYSFFNFIIKGVEHFFKQLNIIYLKEANSFSFIVKIFLSYLYYQLITSIRKDTRK